MSKVRILSASIGDAVLIVRLSWTVTCINRSITLPVAVKPARRKRVSRLRHRIGPLDTRSLMLGRISVQMH